MDTGELLSEGLNLMLLGMGTVFVFLTILVFVTTFMSSLVQKYQPAPQPELGSKSSTKPNDQTLLVIISAALHAHRSKK